MFKVKAIGSYMSAIAKLALFANREIKATEGELNTWHDTVVELLERVNDERFRKEEQQDG